MNRYLLEIGVEEFPAKYIKSTQNQIRNGIDKFLKENKYSYASMSINSTPRRFAVLIDGISSQAESSVEKVKGPSKKIAYKDGEPSKALLGFLKSKGLKLEDITFEEVNGEEYVFANIVGKTKDIKEVLKEGIPAMIKAISNPKAMRWGGKNLRFLRPIRWLVSLLDDEILEFDLEGISVSNKTKGHRTLSSGLVEITKIDEYEEKLEENFVIVSEEKRRNIITRGINILSKEKGGNYLQDEDLLEEIIYINEYPTPFIGNFGNEYLALPKEVIITPMKDHQRYFPIEDDNGNLLPYFISVRNGDDKGIDNVSKGNEKVLRARLEDAKFFYNQDISVNFEDYVEKLNKLGFHDGLGNMYDKTLRLEKLVATIGEKLNASQESIDIAVRAAHLSKADLITKSVIEFTELQGIMGRIFALKSGENKLVASAIEEQYMPVQAGARLPETTAGVILSLAEKIDNIAGLHSLGIKVTGSQDQYGQRRAVLGIINILIENRMSLDLADAIREALYLYVEGFGETFNYEEVIGDLIAFIKSRYRNKMIEEGYRHDLIDAVLSQEVLDIFIINEKLLSLARLLDNKGFDDLITKFVRVYNISKKAESLEVREDILKDGDVEIYGLNVDLDEVDKLSNSCKFDEALAKLVDLIPTVDRYLDNTMINVEDEDLKNNRLVLVKNISIRIESIFNPSLIVRS